MAKRVLCFGDSNTWGAVPGDSCRYPEDIRWTGILQKELGAGYTVVEEGYNGRTTVFDDPVEGRLAGISYFAPCLDSQSPLDLVILMLGTNDLKARFAVDGYTIAHGFSRYLAALATTPMDGQKPQVLLVSPILIDASYADGPLFRDMFGPGAVERSQQLAEAYEAFAQANGWHYLNAADYAVASTRDGVHMEPDSHRCLALAMAAKVREILA